MKFVFTALALHVCASATWADQARETTKAPSELTTIASLDVPRYWALGTK